MEEIGAFEARKHLSRLLQRVAAGERFVITRHGRPVAELIPYGERGTAEVEEALAGLRRLRTRLAKAGVRVDDLLAPGETLRDLAHRDHRCG